MLVEVPDVRDFEIVVGIVAPIGTDVDTFVSLLQRALEDVDYKTESLRLSQLLDETAVGGDLPSRSSDADYYRQRMDAGDELRRLLGSDDALAAYAIARIRDLRFKQTGSYDQNRRHAWILRTVKHPEEVSLLRATYGRRFVLVSASSSESDRRANLRRTLRDASPAAAEMESKLASLIERDESDASRTHGQHVRDAFSMADFFVLYRDIDQARLEVERIIGMLFGSPFITPTRDEHAMFLAFGASLRSSDPGRQVGAVVTSSRGDVLAVGANEVPRPGGGEYWQGDSPDHRDFREGSDFNRRENRRLMQELLDALASEGYLSSALTELSSGDRVDSVVTNGSASLASSRVRSLIEFGRIVHAEMSAISEAARSTQSIVGATLYTTAFPCHMCMRLIIAAGIRRVVFVDPYPKSLASEMYATEINVGESCSDGRVSVESFVGTSWRVYADLFEAMNRKRDALTGQFVPWSRRGAAMRLAEVDPLVRADVLEAQVPPALEDRVRQLD